MIKTGKGIDNAIIIEIDKENVFRYIGYDRDSKPQGNVISLIEHYSERLPGLIVPAYSYILKQIRGIESPVIALEDNTTFECAILAEVFKNCTRVAIAIATIDNYLEEAVTWLSKRSLTLEATILDSIGSDAIEKLSDGICKRIAEEVEKEKLVVTRRFSPGNCGWPIEDQVKLFNLLGDDQKDVQLTEDGIMLPRKSLSFIVGIGPAEKGIQEYNPCKSCDKTDCYGRR